MTQTPAAPEGEFPWSPPADRPGGIDQSAGAEPDAQAVDSGQVPPGLGPRSARSVLSGLATLIRATNGQIPVTTLDGSVEPGTDWVHDLTDWWGQVAETDAEKAADKAAEYGQLDLEIMGTAMVGLMRGSAARTERVNEMTEEERRQLGLEMSVAFYELGKVARLFGAYAAGRLPSDDTWHDGTVYPMMARRIREVGNWVGES